MANKDVFFNRNVLTILGVGSMAGFATSSFPGDMGLDAGNGLLKSLFQLVSVIDYVKTTNGLTLP